MTASINLLPEAYRRARVHDRRFQVGVTVGLVLLLAELGAGLALHTRADATRRLRKETGWAREEAAGVKAMLVEPAAEARHIQQQITLARRLRTTHRWSRLLAILSQVTPDNVVLSSIATDPARWTPDLEPPPGDAKKKGKRQDASAKPLLQGMTLRGHAADHLDLSLFTESLSGAGAFATVSLKQARRGEVNGQEAIEFEVQCRW